MLGFAILATAIVVSLYYRHKYAPIFCQLSELLADKDPGETVKPIGKSAEKTDSYISKATEQTNKATGNPTHTSKNEPVDVDKFVMSLYEKQYRQMTETIRKEQLYTMPKFGRSDMMKRFHMTGKRISTVFSMAGTSVPVFIRECRLEHAKQLIAERPDMTLVEIATASGFIHASTFAVDFKNKYGVTPIKYREQKAKETSNATND